MQYASEVGVAVVAVAAIAVWYVLKVRWLARSERELLEKSKRAEEEAAREADRLKKERLIEAKDEIFNWRSEAEKKIQDQKNDVMDLERRLLQRKDSVQQRESTLKRQQQDADRRLDEVRQREEQLDASAKKLDELVAEETRRLESVAGLTAEEAKETLIKRVESDALHDAALLAKRIEEEARQKAEIEARKVVVQAIQRCAAEHVVESSVSVVGLPSDDMKGRIIGREGRNIRALEQATGVDLIVDDTPEAVLLSGFDPLRREIAKQSIELLIKDGRIHPARIEEVVTKVQRDMDKRLSEEGEQVAFELGVHDLHADLLKMLGRLKYRTSYGQNVLYHSREVAYLGGIMAREVGARVSVCKRAGLLHDVGKAVDRDMEGTHLQLGVEFARKCGEDEDVVHAMEAHHFDVEFRTLEAVLVQSADAISAARPGARREVLENYIKRLEQLEDIASSFPGVAKAFALQAGREIRIIVESSQISDEQAFWLSKDIAKKIEKDLQYPGQIKVTLIRETRVVDYAK